MGYIKPTASVVFGPIVAQRFTTYYCSGSGSACAAAYNRVRKEFMKIRKSVYRNLLLFSPLLITTLLVAYKISSIDLTRFWFLSAVILIFIVHFFRYQLSLFKHFISIDDNKLIINSKAHKIRINLKDIKKIECTNNILNINSDGLKYEFNLAMFDVRKTQIFVEKLNKMVL